MGAVCTVFSSSKKKTTQRLKPSPQYTNPNKNTESVTRPSGAVRNSYKEQPVGLHLIYMDVSQSNYFKRVFGRGRGGGQWQSVVCARPGSKTNIGTLCPTFGSLLFDSAPTLI